MTQEMHLICESIQEVTLIAWPIVWADNKYDQDSRVVLEMLRNWGEEFENWWISHDEDWICDHDYIECVERYAEIKSRRYVQSVNPVEERYVELQRNLQEFTAVATDRMHYDKIYGALTEDLHMTREEAFDKIREFADQYMCDFDARDDEKDVFDMLEGDQDEACKDTVAEYLERKVAEMKGEK